MADLTLESVPDDGNITCTAADTWYEGQVISNDAVYITVMADTNACYLGHHKVHGGARGTAGLKIPGENAFRWKARPPDTGPIRFYVASADAGTVARCHVEVGD